MEKKHIVIVGTSFAGYTGALELREHLEGEDHEITVIAPSPEFVFIPSLIWLPFGLRDKEDISFDVRPVYDKHRIDFVESRATSFDLDRRAVITEQGELQYDYLLIATGPKIDFESIEGLGPHRNSWSVCTVDHAMETRQAWNNFLDDPGPVVIGATQGAACFGAAYEFLLNTRYQLKKKKLIDKCPITLVTAEPYLAHFGIGGFGNAREMCEKMFARYGIHWHTSAVVKEVKPETVVLESGEALPSKFTMLIPRFLGVDAVRSTSGLANQAGFIEVDGTYQHPTYKEVFAAGVAVHVPPPEPTPVPCGVPKTGYPCEQMAKTAVWNIAASIRGDEERKNLPYSDIKALCIMDTGNMGMFIVGDHMLSPRAHEAIIPGPQAHWAKVAFEKYFLSTRKRGVV